MSRTRYIAVSRLILSSWSLSLVTPPAYRKGNLGATSGQVAKIFQTSPLPANGVGALDCPRRGSGRRRAAAPMPEGLQTPRAKQNPGARRAPGFRKRTDLGPAHFFLAEDLEPPFDEPFEPDLEPPFAPPDFFAAVAMLVVLEASVILRREDDRTRLLNRNLIHKRR